MTQFLGAYANHLERLDRCPANAEQHTVGIMTIGRSTYSPLHRMILICVAVCASVVCVTEGRLLTFLSDGCPSSPQSLFGEARERPIATAAA